MRDINLDVKLLDGLLGQLIEVWPLGGCRWQRFHLVSYNLAQLKEDNVWPTDSYRHR